MDADLLLTWMSEVGSGDVRDLRQRVAWAARARDRSPKEYEIGRWLRDISGLGHAEIDWQGGNWTIAPAMAPLLPAAGGTAVLAGSRRVGLIDRLEESVAVHVQCPEAGHGGPLPVPSTVFLQADSFGQLRDTLKEAGVQYVGCAARSIAKGLRQIALGDAAARPAQDDAAEHISANAEYVRFCAGLPAGDGLCRTSVYGRPSYRYRMNGSWYHTDHATGILLDRAARGISVMRFQAERVSDGEEIGTVFIDQGAPLPPLQARALVLCSGLPAQFGDLAHTAIYRNVPKDIALLVAESIRQPVSVFT
ncbi:hypothetical protein [Actinomadura madurae]|uniref:hypothetical protein n=1 Tax=Actinomadura madurae TaxID=1993 RepID=UPI000D8E23DE|nr:hypothetical protein [Actinomadura madurae]SPT60533.1 Uncharacterised protein [Actinomadura madurae]